mgnify:CR=1 FL=1
MNLKSIFPDITAAQNQQLARYCALVEEWNRKVNLVSRQDTEHLWAHHILPSAIALKSVKIPPESWLLDIGSGGGFPAIPIKILRPDLQILMVDSIRKKKLFLQKVISDLGLEKISVMNDRIEYLAQNPDFQQKFNLVTARAVAPIANLVDWGKPFLQGKGGYLLWKGTSDIAELKTVAEKVRLQFEVLPVSEKFRFLSPKFEELRFFRIRLSD